MNRRRFLTTALTSTAAAAASPALGQFLNAPRHGLPGTLQERYSRCDAILQQPVFKREIFKDPVIIQSIELLTRDKQYICRVRSKDGHEGIAVSNAQQMEVLYPIFTKRIAPFFIGKDARDIEQLIPASTVYENNYKAQASPSGCPSPPSSSPSSTCSAKWPTAPSASSSATKSTTPPSPSIKPTASATSLPKKPSNTSSTTSPSRTPRPSSSNSAAA